MKIHSPELVVSGQTLAMFAAEQNITMTGLWTIFCFLLSKVSSKLVPNISPSGLTPIHPDIKATATPPKTYFLPTILPRQPSSSWPLCPTLKRLCSANFQDYVQVHANYVGLSVDLPLRALTVKLGVTMPICTLEIHITRHRFMYSMNNWHTTLIVRYC